MKFSFKNFFSKCDQTRKKLQIWPHLLQKSLMENFTFLCSVWETCDVTMDYYYYFIITLFPGIKIQDNDDDTDDNEWEEEES